MKVSSITEDELIQAIEASLADSPEPGLESGTTTTPRIMRRFHIGRSHAAQTINKLVSAGRLVPDRIIFVDAWGTRQHIKGFRWVKDAE